MDSNSFITPKNIYYPFDVFPSYWTVLSDKSANESIYLITQVYDELVNGHEEDLVRRWIENEFHGDVIDTYDSKIVDAWQSILIHLQSSSLYNTRAFDTWADEDVADPWIIAAAKVHGCTVVSLEERNRHLNPGSPTSKVKIPDICDDFNVPYLNLQDMLRELNVSF